jgi:hypothetical protein
MPLSTIFQLLVYRGGQFYFNMHYDDFYNITFCRHLLDIEMKKENVLVVACCLSEEKNFLINLSHYSSYSP